MAIVFVAIVLVLLFTHFVPDSQRLRNFSWLRGWQDQGAAQSSAELGLAITIGLPVLVCLIVQLALRGNVFGLPTLVFAVVVLFYCLGPRDLERDVEAVDKAPDSSRRIDAVQALRPEESSAPLPFQAEPLVEATFTAGLRRVFGVVFWFAVLGPVGALLYRLVVLLAYTPTHAQALPAAQQSLADKFARLLDWLPAHLIALALAIASDFDAVLKTWRDYHAAHGKGYWSLDSGFLGAIARASVDADVEAGDGHAVDVSDPLVELDDAMTLIRRVLIVWLAVLAVVVIAGVFG
ncbi:MAG: regulatory signaling modulator protein AmpE [Rudaea sp.]|uniref:regulatory signaling modulator protein AmpE n=1 Tax=unclassified Rudaea TaxID=2627037 RepID=UPI0010F873A6|nr:MULTISPECIES: regulatory signaling modulator protein AmpE [unclassified Rudaea]MBN8886061.1 regulatory signaling modulator protein AmpE [Rudaea sp.]